MTAAQPVFHFVSPRGQLLFCRWRLFPSFIAGGRENAGRVQILNFPEDILLTLAELNGKIKVFTETRKFWNSFPQGVELAS